MKEVGLRLFLVTIKLKRKFEPTTESRCQIKKNRARRNLRSLVLTGNFHSLGLISLALRNMDDGGHIIPSSGNGQPVVF